MEVEPLEEIVPRFMNWVEPLLDSREYEETLKSAETLKDPSGRGFKLLGDLRRELQKDPSLENIVPSGRVGISDIHESSHLH